jgi:hypothetical protein
MDKIGRTARDLLDSQRIIATRGHHNFLIVPHCTLFRWYRPYVPAAG